MPCVPVRNRVSVRLPSARKLHAKNDPNATHNLHSCCPVAASSCKASGLRLSLLGSCLNLLLLLCWSSWLALVLHLKNIWSTMRKHTLTARCIHQVGKFRVDNFGARAVRVRAP